MQKQNIMQSTGNTDKDILLRHKAVRSAFIQLDEAEYLRVRREMLKIFNITDARFSFNYYEYMDNTSPHSIIFHKHLAKICNINYTNAPKIYEITKI